MTNETSQTPTPTRRSVLRAGAHAAWAVPAVQVATMVPAMAAVVSGNPQLSSVTAARSGSTVAITVSAQHSGTYNGLDIVITKTGTSALPGVTISTVSPTASGWVVQTRPDNKSWRVIHAGNISSPGNAPALSILFSGSHNPSGYTVAASGAGSLSTTVTP